MNLNLKLCQEFHDNNKELYEHTIQDIIKAWNYITACINKGGTVFVAGNGGSFSDSQHIVGEMCKSFERKRPIDINTLENLKTDEKYGKDLIENLEVGFRFISLGSNSTLTSAIINDNKIKEIFFAQELFSLSKPNDILFCISTSGNSLNCLYASCLAKKIGVKVLILTGENKNCKLSEYSDVMINALGNKTGQIQENHIKIYHFLCKLIESAYFHEYR